jgi:hypothetical protein
MIRRSCAASRPNRLANRKASFFSKHSLAHAARALAPTLLALTFATVAQAQGTMDFSGATTLMGRPDITPFAISTCRLWTRSECP